MGHLEVGGCVLIYIEANVFYIISNVYVYIYVIKRA